MVEQVAVNDKVRGSNPLGGATLPHRSLEDIIPSMPEENPLGNKLVFNILSYNYIYETK